MTELSIKEAELLTKEKLIFPVGEVETVMGAKLLRVGRILSHEHLASDLNPKMPYLEGIQPFINLQNCTIYKRTRGIYENMRLCDRGRICNFFYDMYEFKKYGGTTIVDNSSYGMRRNFNLIYRICRTTKIDVLLGTGFSLPAVFENSQYKTETLYMVMRNDLEKGFNWDRILPELRPLKYPKVKSPKAAFIGEVGSDWPISDFARRSIVATGLLQKELRCPVNLVPSLYSDAPEEILRIYQEAGGDARKAVMSNVDCALSNKAKFLEFLDNTDCYVQFSSFGYNKSIIPRSNCNLLTDPQRIKRIAMMKKENLLHRVLMSHNIYSKDRLIPYGGHGYSFIMTCILPHMQQMNNFTFNDTFELTVLNPARWLKRGT